MFPAWSALNAPQIAAVRLRSVGLALVLMAVVLSTSKTASASCGDYLFRNGKPVASHGLSHAEMPAEHEVVVQKSGSTDVPEQAPIERCKGPNCSKSPIPFAPSPSAPLSQVRVSDPAALLGSILSGADTREVTEFPESEQGARYLPSSVFRPPAI